MLSVAHHGALPRASLSLLVQRKVTKESTPRPSRPSRCAAGVRVAGGNFGTAHPVPTQNAAHPCAAPSGFAHRRHRFGRGPKARSKAIASIAPKLGCSCCSRLCVCSSGPRSGVASGPGKTRRAAHRTCAVFGRGRMPLPKIPGPIADPERTARRARRPGGCFLLVTFLCTSKEK